MDGDNGPANDGTSASTKVQKIIPQEKIKRTTDQVLFNIYYPNKDWKGTDIKRQRDEDADPLADIRNNEELIQEFTESKREDDLDADAAYLLAIAKGRTPATDVIQRSRFPDPEEVGRE